MLKLLRLVCPQAISQAYLLSTRATVIRRSMAHLPKHAGFEQPFPRLGWQFASPCPKVLAKTACFKTIAFLCQNTNSWGKCPLHMREHRRCLHMATFQDNSVRSGFTLGSSSSASPHTTLEGQGCLFIWAHSSHRMSLFLFSFSIGSLPVTLISLAQSPT